MSTPNYEFIKELDSDDYDTEAMIIDDQNNNFDPANVSDYLQSNIILNSLYNGQFSQAKAQCLKWGFYYPEMRRHANLNSV